MSRKLGENPVPLLSTTNTGKKPAANRLNHGTVKKGTATGSERTGQAKCAEGTSPVETQLRGFLRGHTTKGRGCSDVINYRYAAA
jgi:hypothetical protein